MAHVDFSISGDGVHDLGTYVVITDILCHVTAITPNANLLDETVPEFTSRFGFIALGGPNNWTGTMLDYYQPPLWIHNVNSTWNFEGTNTTTLQFIRWHLFPGHTADVRVYY